MLLDLLLTPAALAFFFCLRHECGGGATVLWWEESLLAFFVGWVDWLVLGKRIWFLSRKCLFFVVVFKRLNQFYYFIYYISGDFIRMAFTMLICRLEWNLNSYSTGVRFSLFNGVARGFVSNMLRAHARSLKYGMAFFALFYFMTICRFFESCVLYQPHNNSIERFHKIKRSTQVDGMVRRH